MTDEEARKSQHVQSSRNRVAGLGLFLQEGTFIGNAINRATLSAQDMTVV